MRSSRAAPRAFRPIVMTTTAMIAGMLPLALALEPGSQARASLWGSVVIGGLSSSLILTLFIVPIMYAWIAPEELSEPIKIGRGKQNETRPGDDGAPGIREPTLAATGGMRKRAALSGAVPHSRPP